MFVYFIIYKTWDLISFGLSQMKYRAAFTLALITALNIYAILKLIGIDIELMGNLYVVIFLLIWIGIHLIIFGNEKIHSNLINKYKNKDFHIKVVYAVSTLLYTTLSIYFVTFN
jgi:cation transport ATPase